MRNVRHPAQVQAVGSNPAPLSMAISSCQVIFFLSYQSQLTAGKDRPPVCHVPAVITVQRVCKVGLSCSSHQGPSESAPHQLVTGVSNMTETIVNHRPNPCKGCPDRYPACSDHCRKPSFLTWKAEQQKIREARRAYYSPVWQHEEGTSSRRKPPKRERKK